VKRFSRFRHSVLHMDCAYYWNVSVFYFAYCATAKIKQFRLLETEFVLLLLFSFISDVRAPLEKMENNHRRPTEIVVVDGW